MIALSIRQPWAWHILNSGKDIENRDWPTRFRGRVLIHASKGMTRAEYEDGQDPLWASGGPTIELPPIEKLERGGIVGSVEIVDCVAASDSPWFFGRFGFMLRNPKPLPFVPWKGQLGFFDVPESALVHSLSSNPVMHECDSSTLNSLYRQTSYRPRLGPAPIPFSAPLGSFALR